MKRTGGEKTDELLGKKGGPEGLPDSIIVTAEGVEGDLPILTGEIAPEPEAAAVAPAPAEIQPPVEEQKPKKAAKKAAPVKKAVLKAKKTSKKKR